MYEPFGGLCAGLEAILEGIRVHQYFYSDPSQPARLVAEFRIQQLLRSYPNQFPASLSAKISAPPGTAGACTVHTPTPCRSASPSSATSDSCSRNSRHCTSWRMLLCSTTSGQQPSVMSLPTFVTHAVSQDFVQGHAAAIYDSNSSSSGKPSGWTKPNPACIGVPSGKHSSNAGHLSRAPCSSPATAWTSVA